MATKAGGAYIEIRAEDAHLDRDLNKAQTKIGVAAGKMQQRVKTAFKLMAVAAVASTAMILKTSISQFADFEVALNRLGNVSSRSLGSMRKDIMGMSPQLGTVTELTKGYYQVLSAGITETNASMKMLTVSAKMSKEASVAQGEAVRGLSSVMSTYSDELETATDAADLLYTIEAKGKTSVGELIPYIGRLANMSKMAGLSANEMAASLAAITQSGAGTAVSVTQMIALLNNLNVKWKELPESIQKYGTVAAAVKALKFEGVLKEIAKATDGNQAAMKRMMESVEAQGALFQLTKNKFAAYGDSLEGMTKKTGAFDDAWKRYSKTLTAIWETFKNSIGRQAVLLGEKLAPKLGDVVKKMAAWVEQNDKLIGQKVEATIDKIGTSIEKMITVYNSLPNGVIGAAGTGIIVGILTGSHPIGWAVAGLMLLNTQLERFNMNIGAIPKKITAGGDVMNTFADIFSGKRDWDTGALKGVALEFDNLTRAAARSLEEIKNVQTAAPSIGGKGIGGVPADGSVAPPPPPPSAVPSQFAATSQRFEGGFQVTEGAQTLIDADKKKYEEQARLRMEFNTLYMELGKSQFDLEREQILTQSEVWKLAGANKIQIAQLTSDKIKAIDRAEKQQRLNDMQSLVGGMAANFKQIAEMGGKHSKKAFAMYKAFKITETLIATYSAAIKAFQALAPIPIVGPALGVAAAAMAVAFGMAQVQMIRSSQPPSYDQGGISSAKGVYQTGNIDEAHIPLKGGKVPVNVTGGGDTYFIVKMENPVFQDAATQRQVFAQLAEVIAKRVAPGAVVQDYQNDGQTRQMIRGRA